MDYTSGDKVGSYEIEALLGRGQLAAALREHGGEAHTNVVSGELGMSVPNTRNVVVIAIRRGPVHRGGKGTGVATLVVDPGQAAGVRQRPGAACRAENPRARRGRGQTVDRSDPRPRILARRPVGRSSPQSFAAVPV